MPREETRETTPKDALGSVAAIEAKAKAGASISLTDLAKAIKANKVAPTRPRGRTKAEKPSIRESLAAGRREIEKQNSTQGKAAQKNAELGG